MQELLPEKMQEVIAAWDVWFEKLDAKEVLLCTGSPLSAAKARTVNADKVFSDSPFAEIKEYICGYITIQASTIENAAEIAKDSPVLIAGGSVEIREIVNATR